MERRKTVITVTKSYDDDDDEMTYKTTSVYGIHVIVKIWQINETENDWQCQCSAVAMHCCTERDWSENFAEMKSKFQSQIKQ
jgi:hypothetical protein